MRLKIKQLQEEPHSPERDAIEGAYQQVIVMAEGKGNV
jgi:hypothetical protein